MGKLLSQLATKVFSFKQRIAKLADDEGGAGGSWKTINGRRVFIRKGQSVQDALNPPKGLNSAEWGILRPALMKKWDSVGQDLVAALEGSNQSATNDLVVDGLVSVAYDDLSKEEKAILSKTNRDEIAKKLKLW